MGKTRSRGRVLCACLSKLTAPTPPRLSSGLPSGLSLPRDLYKVPALPAQPYSYAGRPPQQPVCVDATVPPLRVRLNSSRIVVMFVRCARADHPEYGTMLEAARAQSLRVRAIFGRLGLAVSHPPQGQHELSQKLNDRHSLWIVPTARVLKGCTCLFGGVGLGGERQGACCRQLAGTAQTW